jgi:hypothetical protein
MADNEKRTIRYTNFDFNEIIQELQGYLEETNTFKDANFDGSNIRVLMEILAILTSQSSYYIHAAANEVFLPTARLYKNINKIAQTLAYDARGKTSAQLDVVGSLNPEYVFGKETQYIEIPAYSVFPSNMSTSDGEEFNFTNPKPIVYIVRGFGVTELLENDIRYKNYALPHTAPASFFKKPDGTIAIDPTKITIPLSIYKPLTIVKRSDSENYRPYDLENYPSFNPSDSQSVGQPFTNTLGTIESGSDILPEVEYSLLMNYDTATSYPYLSVEENDSVIADREDDVMATIILENVGDDLYTMRVNEIKSYQRFYTGVLGMKNLQSVNFDYDTIPGSNNSVQRVKMIINQDGNSPTFSALINGNIYDFNPGTIFSQTIEAEFWDSNVDFFNINLIINDPDSPETNYGATLSVTSKEPVVNQITIARIYTNYVDPETGTKTLQSDAGNRYGDLKVVEAAPVKTSEEKAGRIFFNSETTVERILFEKDFELLEDESSVEYHISLTPEGNVRTWYANKNEGGFDLYIEPDSQFEGYINWKATRVITENTRNVQVAFEQPVSPTVTLEGEVSNYMVQLTPNDNVQVWYENATPEGFTIRTEREFQGRISWSVVNYYANQEVPIEPESIFRQRGTVQIDPDSPSVNISLDVPINQIDYAIQLIPNKNVNVWYTSKSSTGFTINIEPGITTETLGTVDIDWYVDSSFGYNFQQHGEVDFSGQSGNRLNIPGLRFINVRETFDIEDLLQGSVTLSVINTNTVVDSTMNGLNLSLDPTRQFQTDSKFIVNNEEISTNSIRIFVRDEAGVWNEWKKAGTGFDVDTAPGEEVYFVRVNPDKLITIEFGDGDVWGTSISEKEVFVFGLNSVGEEGNITRNTLNDEVIISKYILGNDNTNVQFQQDLINLIGLKTRVYFQGGSASTAIVDSEETRLKNRDLLVTQNKNAFGGNEVESVDEIRQNAPNSFIRQNRNVSITDYDRFVREVFRDYLQESKVLTYEEIKEEGLIPESELSKYWFNHIFVVGLNKDGSNIISKNLRDEIVNILNGATFKMIGTEHEVVAAKWVPVDVLVRYKKSQFGSFEQVETQIRKNLNNYFDPENHSLGETINHSDLVQLVKVDFVEAVEVMLNKDPEEEFNAADYNVSVRQTEQDLDIARRNKIMSLVAKDPSLVRVFQPVFDVIKTDGTKEWTYTLNVQFEKNEFPVLGDIILEREV